MDTTPKPIGLGSIKEHGTEDMEIEGGGGGRMWSVIRGGARNRVADKRRYHHG